MGIGIITGIVLAILVVAAIIAATTQTGSLRGVSAVMAVLLFLAFIVVPFSFRTVDTGEVAVVKVLGEAKSVETAGTSFAFWLTTKYDKYDAKVQNVDIVTAAYSSDAQTMDVQMTLQYQIMTDKVLEIANQYGSLAALQTRIQSIAIEKTKAILSSHKAMDIIADRASISPAVEIAIKDAIDEEYFVNVNTVVLTNIDFSDAFEQAVEEKMIAEQSKLRAEYENETKVAQAKAEADAKIAAAEAEIEIAKAKAEALKIEAEAEAAANETIAASLTDIILEKIYADKWDGKLPEVMTGSDGASILIPAPESGN